MRPFAAKIPGRTALVCAGLSRESLILKFAPDFLLVVSLPDRVAILPFSEHTGVAGILPAVFALDACKKLRSLAENENCNLLLRNAN